MTPPFSSPTSSKMSFTLLAQEDQARRGVLKTPRGSIQTPAFMPVGTAASVKGLYPSQVRDSGAEVLLGNTYHLMLRPGAEEIAALGGLHHFMNWPFPILTDSGGYQVMSLAKLCKINDQGAVFQSHIDGRRYELTPERAMEIQRLLGSDIHMCLDQCVEFPCGEDQQKEAMHRSLHWAERSQKAFGTPEHQLLFGIVQGGTTPHLRKESAQALVAMGFEGLAVGGLAVGEPQDVMLATLTHLMPFLPALRPRYLMGAGTPSDLLESVALGIDMFDCVLPTRAGRHGIIYTHRGRFNLKNARYASDPTPLDPQARCEMARTYSRAYLHHLIRSREILGMIILSYVNLAYYQELMEAIRHSILTGSFRDFYHETKTIWKSRAR